MIKIVEGDLLDATEDIIGHQVNCRAKMSAGIAKQIKNRCPRVFALYQMECELADKPSSLLGKCQVVMYDTEGDAKGVANLFAQDRYGTDKQYTDYDALEMSLHRLKNYAKPFGFSVALPENLGCGLAGGSWSEVYKIIDDVFNDYEVALYRLN